MFIIIWYVLSFLREYGGSLFGREGVKILTAFYLYATIDFLNLTNNTHSYCFLSNESKYSYIY